MSNYTFTSSAPATRDRNIPLNVVKLLSPYVKAHECFVGQKFSSELQTFLINYNLSITGANVLYV